MSKSISDIFVKEAIKTESPITSDLIERLNAKRTIRLLHAAMGMVTEAGEIMDALKKFIFYGKDLDIVNLKEEAGDSNWYQALIHDELGSSFDEVMILVIQKLRKRYHNKEFSNEAAINRDLQSERSELEKEIDLATGFNMGAKKLAEHINMEIIDEDYSQPRVHWLSDVETLEVLCGNKKENDKYTLESNLLTCEYCFIKLVRKNGTYNNP